jgi:ribosomal protein L1
MNISTHDQWAFVYSGAFKKWLLKTSPWANTGNTRQLPVPNKARMMVNLTSALAGNIVLPATAGDRDRIIVKTRSSQAYEIDKANTLDGAPSRLTARSQYEYVFTKETGKWERAAEPRGATYEAYQYPTGQLPRLNTSTTTVHFADANWFPTLFLPKGYGKGTRIIVDTEATYNVKVSGEGVNDVLKTGELAVFVANESGAWSRETRTVDLLLMYSDKVASALGESAARARLMQSLILTNQALENSRANFRYRVVAMRKFTAPKWKSGSMYDLRTDPTAQAWLEEVKADGLHYLSDEGYSGSWINGGKVNHVTVSDINLATTSMRYFIAFPAGGDRQSAYAQGYDELGSILGGNINAFYSNTQRITPDHGIRTGVDGKKDVVRAMNERSARIAAYR